MKNLKVNVYCIKDDITGFMQPWCEHSDDSAVRQFEMVIKKEGSMFALHPEQFNLFKIGVFDTESGDIEKCMEFIQNGAIFKSIIKE